MPNLKKLYLGFLKNQSSKNDPFLNKLNQLNSFYLPLSSWINRKRKEKNGTLLISLSGGQGSGKSTIAQILKLILNKNYKLKVTCFSLDDFYKTPEERKKMSINIHPLFVTRGVPGTHDHKMLLNIIKKLKSLNFRPLQIPKFDKSTDNRMKKFLWQKVKCKPDIIIFEGWCIGAKPQSTKVLKKPMNYLEKKLDIKLTWRKKVNNELKTNYKKIFKLVDSKIFLKVPSFKYVLKWRKLQEKKLRFKFKRKTMNNREVERFTMYYERLTKQMIKDSSNFDAIIKIDKKHRIKSVKYS